MLLATLVTLGVGGAIKAPCASAAWADGRQYRQLCYSDIVPLLGTEELTGNRLPYLDPCAGSAVCDEYPVATMYFMRVAAWISHGYVGFFWANAAGLALCALVTAWALYRMVGRRALLFALSPTLALYGFMNWDLLAVMLATLATLAFLRARDRSSGILLGVGTAAKLYPALFVPPFALDRLKGGRVRSATVVAAWAAGTWLVLNGPFAVLRFGSWSEFFRFNATRGVDWDSLWFVACSHFGATASCTWPPQRIDPLALAIFAGLATIVWRVREARDPSFPRWTFGFPMLVLFLLANKVYSPQYSLWLLPWIALVEPGVGLFAAFSAAEVAVFLTRFTWFGTLMAEAGVAAYHGYHGATLREFQIALLVRDAVLVAYLVTWTLRRGSLAPSPAGAPAAGASEVEPAGTAALPGP